nr:1-acyl-sn-glycerol-3-phosphate acyltransferase [Catenulispora rubra]
MAEREYVYPPVIRAMKGAFRALDLKIDVHGADRIPRSGGAVLASNHISYLDFIFAGAAALPSRRRVRFMAKKEVFDNRISGPLMRGMRHIPVDREAGLSSYRQALECLKSGEIVGVFGEATISRSFMIKDLKNGAVRMAQAADVPLIPVVLWGTQRLWTKGKPRRLWQRHVPITVLVGEPMYPKKGQNSAELSAELHARLSALLDEAQSTYPDKPSGPADSWWLPAHLGGTAPTLEQAAEMDARGRGEGENGTEKKTEAEAEAQVEAKATAEAKPELKAEPTPDTKPETETEPEAKAEPQPEVEAKAEPELKAEPQPESEPEAMKPEPKPDKAAASAATAAKDTTPED